MDRVLEIASQMFRAEQARIEGIGMNISAANTPGYKRSLQTAPSFELSLTGSVQEPKGTARSTTNSTIDLKPGKISETTNPLDFAVMNQGFFELVTDENRAVYTRSGQFSIDSLGRLVSTEGYRLQGQSGDIVVKDSSFRLEIDGVITQNGQPIDRLKLVEISDVNTIEPISPRLYQLKNGEVPRKSTDSVVRQGALETSNVDTATEYVQLMEAIRRLELAQKIVHTRDDMLDKAIRKIGELQ